MKGIFRGLFTGNRRYGVNGKIFVIQRRPPPDHPRLPGEGRVEDRGLETGHHRRQFNRIFRSG